MTPSDLKRLPARAEVRESDLYLTPEFVLVQILRALEIDRFDFDPFGHPNTRVPASWQMCLEWNQDAFKDPWPRARTAFMNPPFSMSSRCLELWVQRWREGAFERSAALVLASVGSNYWHECVWPTATCVTFLPRISFYDQHGRLTKHTISRDVAIVWHGPVSVARVREIFDDSTTVVTL